MPTKVIRLKNEYSFLDINGAEPTLSCYLHEGSAPDALPRPALIVCPGGGYWGCAYGEGEPVAIEFTKAGLNCFVLTYSCRPHVFPQALREVAAAVDYIHRNAESLGVDSSRVAIMGFSAGGHLSASYSTMYDDPAVREVIDSKPVQASVLCYPVISAEPDFCHISSIQTLTGHDILTDDDIAHFSAEKHVSSATPPAFLWHTAADNVVPVRNSLEYALNLRKNGVNYEMHIFPEGGHGLGLCNNPDLKGYDAKSQEYAAVWVDMAKNWLKKIFDI